MKIGDAMAMYVDDFCFLELAGLFEGHRFDGTAEYDGLYGIALVFILPDETAKDISIGFPSRKDRDASFSGIVSALVEYCKADDVCPSDFEDED